ncbi:MAG: FliH/SctL family protein [Chitinophagales bacterium]
MSKVIKSHELIVSQPIPLNTIPSESQDVDTAWKPEVNRVDDEITESIENVYDIDKVKEEADSILRETESMVTEILEKARQQAMNMVSEGKEEAQELKIQATEEAEQIKRNAADEAYREGWQRAMEESEEERRRAVTESEALIEEAMVQRLDIIRSSEEIILRLAMAIAKKIIEKEIKQNPDIIISLIRDAVDLLKDAETIKILVNPKDFELLLNEQNKIANQEKVNARINIQSDTRISAGGFIVESEIGTTDARLETRIDNVENVLMEVAARGN